MAGETIINDGISLEEDLNRIIEKMVEQAEQVSNRMSELERAVHIEQEGLREEILRNKQEASRSEKRIKEKWMITLPEIWRKAEQREQRLRDDMQLRWTFFLQEHVLELSILGYLP